MTATGDDMRLRFPEGMRSVVDATLALQGPAAAPVLSGTVTVKNASWTRGFDSSANVFSLGGADRGCRRRPARWRRRRCRCATTCGSSPRPPLQHRERRRRGSWRAASLSLRGTFDRPLLFGRAEIERGEVRFEGRRYQVTRGSLDFTNPNRIQPFFDIEAETRVRVPGQTYRVTLRMAGTTERMQPEFTSDPPLAPIDILTLLFSDTPRAGDIELASLRQPNQREQDILQARATRALTGALSEEVGRVVQETFGVDTLPDHAAPDRSRISNPSRLNVNPAARVTIGKRISDRVYLTYARSLSSSTRDEIILLEYDQNDRLGVGALAATKIAPTRWKSGRGTRSDAAPEAPLETRAPPGAARAAVRGRRPRDPSSARPPRAPTCTISSDARMVDVRVEIGGAAVSEPAVLRLIETRIGEPLSMTDVRETIDHLVGLGRFEDVQLFARARPGGARRRAALAAAAGAAHRRHRRSPASRPSRARRCATPSPSRWGTRRPAPASPRWSTPSPATTRPRVCPPHDHDAADARPRARARAPHAGRGRRAADPHRRASRFAATRAAARTRCAPGCAWTRGRRTTASTSTPGCRRSPTTSATRAITKWTSR